MSEKVSITKSKLDSLANAIASVGETSVPKTIAQMESAVLELTIPPNLQSKTITPSITQQIVSPDSGYDGFSSVMVNAIKLQEKTITPTTEQQVVTPDSIEYTIEIPVGTVPTSSTYQIQFTSLDPLPDGSGTYSYCGKISCNNNVDIILSGTDTAVNGRLPLQCTVVGSTSYTIDDSRTYLESSVFSGHYIKIEFESSAPSGGVVSEKIKVWQFGQEDYDGLSKVTVDAMPSGTAGTPTATKGTVSNHSISVTPSVTNTTGYITGSTINGTPVTVDVTELESGTKSITENGTGISVSGYSTVDVDVQAGTIIDDGDGNINLSPTGEVAVITPLTVNQNGTYTAPSNTGYSPVTVNITKDNYKDVNFIDYDGTLLYSYTKTEFANLSALPANPTHTGLTSQGWNWTKAQITAQLTAMPNQPVWVGQMYVTTSGATEIDIELNNPDYLSPYLTIAVNGTVSIDWGDRTTTSTITGTSTGLLTYTLHEYATIGNYTIKISVVSGSFALYNNSNSTAAILSVYEVNSNRRNNRTYAETVKRIFIGNSASIGNNAFSNCYTLNSITIPSSVTSIGNNAFQYCYALQSITVPSSVTTISINVFNRCYALQNITIPSSVTTIGGGAFQYCYALQSITIPSSVTNIGNNAFTNCCALQSITIPSNVTSINSSTFANCYALQSITIPSSVTTIGSSTFADCYALQSITIPSSVTRIGSSTFTDCYALQSITIPSNVTSIGNNAFQYCYALQSVTIPSGVTSIENQGFQFCYAVEEYHITPTTPPTLGTKVFDGIIAGTIIYVPSASLDTYKTASNWSTYASYMQGE